MQKGFLVIGGVDVRRTIRYVNGFRDCERRVCVCVCVSVRVRAYLLRRMVVFVWENGRTCV